MNAAEEIGVGDLVKVMQTARTKVSPKNLSGRYGHVTKIEAYVATIQFNDFSGKALLDDLEKQLDRTVPQD